MLRGIAKPYAARVKDGSNTITTAAESCVQIQIDMLDTTCIIVLGFFFKFDNFREIASYLSHSPTGHSNFASVLH